MRRMLAAFTYRDFRVQWIGACTSSIGTWMQIAAQNWLIVSLTHSPFYLGLDAFLQQLPIILFSLIGGVFADRYDRRRTLIVSQVIQMATSGTLAVLMFLQIVEIWHVLALSFVTGCAQSFGGPAYQSLIPSLVDKKDLPNAVALNSIQFNVARVLGPLAFGLTLVMFGPWGYSEPQAMNACFLLNSLSFLVVITTLMMLHVKHIPPAKTGKMAEELRSGLSYVKHHGSLAALVVLAAATTFLGFAVLAFSTVTSLVQLIAPNEMRGRVMSIYMLAFRGGMPLGSLVSGWFAKFIGAPVVIGINGALLIVVAAYFLARRGCEKRGHDHE